MASNSKSTASNNFERTAEEVLEVILMGLVRTIGMLGWWVIRFPVASAPVVVTLAALALGGWRLGPFMALSSALIYGLWWVVDPDSFLRAVWHPIRVYWLSWSRYKRSWEEVCTLNGLTAQLDERLLVPRLLSVRIGDTGDTLAVRIVTGQTASDWRKKGPALAEAWGCLRLTVRSARPGVVILDAHRRDELSRAISLPRPDLNTRPVLTEVTVGVAEGGRPWQLPVFGHSILVAGATGSGKGSVLHAIIAGLAPAVRAGTVRLCVIDPKGGMELGRGAPLYAAFSNDNAEVTLDLLRTLVKGMQARTARLEKHTRLLAPTQTEPLVVLIIDELASLTAYCSDNKTRAEIKRCLELLLSQGRAVGVSVIAAVQDPSKETLPFRQLFVVRVGLRMTEDTQTAMVLGAAAREAGAVCEQIPESTPGVGYVIVDGTNEIQRVRAHHVTDADIDYVASNFVSAAERRRQIRRT